MFACLLACRAGQGKAGQGSLLVDLDTLTAAIDPATQSQIRINNAWEREAAQWVQKAGGYIFYLFCDVMCDVMKDSQFPCSGASISTIRVLLALENWFVHPVRALAGRIGEVLANERWGLS